MYRSFMDMKAQQMFENYCENIVNRNFDENMVCGFYIFIRNYLNYFRGKYKWIKEWGNIIAHRVRDRGIVYDNMKNAINNGYQLVDGTMIIKGYRGMQEGELEKEFSHLLQEANYYVSRKALKEIVLCTFLIASFSEYILSNPKRSGQIHLFQTENGLALCSFAGEQEDIYIGLATLTGKYIRRKFFCGYIDKPLEIKRTNGELVILYEGKEI